MNSHAENRIDTLPHLTRLPLFATLAPQRIAGLAELARGKRLVKGEMLFQKGDTAHGFYLIVYGQVKLAFPSANGNEKVVDIINAQQSFGEAVMLAQQPYPVFAQALADSLLIYIPRDAVFDLLQCDSAFATRMLIGLALHNHSLVNDIESYTLRSSVQRVICYLLEHCPAADTPVKSVEIVLPTSKQVTASRLNLTPETFSRILHELMDGGLIAMVGKRIVIPDLPRLRAAIASDGADAPCYRKALPGKRRPQARQRVMAVSHGDAAHPHGSGRSGERTW